jgi:hypothetical protein
MGALSKSHSSPKNRFSVRIAPSVSAGKYQEFDNPPT